MSPHNIMGFSLSKSYDDHKIVIFTVIEVWFFRKVNYFVNTTGLSNKQPLSPVKKMKGVSKEIEGGWGYPRTKNSKKKCFLLLSRPALKESRSINYQKKDLQ